MTCHLPDAFHVKPQHARDIAIELVRTIALRGRQCLYIDPAGAVQVAAHVLDIPDPFSLVGVYDDTATVGEIADDILAIQREPIHGKAEP